MKSFLNNTMNIQIIPLKTLRHPFDYTFSYVGIYRDNIHFPMYILHKVYKVWKLEIPQVKYVSDIHGVES